MDADKINLDDQKVSKTTVVRTGTSNAEVYNRGTLSI